MIIWSEVKFVRRAHFLVSCTACKWSYVWLGRSGYLWKELLLVTGTIEKLLSPNQTPQSISTEEGLMHETSAIISLWCPLHDINLGGKTKPLCNTPHWSSTINSFFRNLPLLFLLYHELLLLGPTIYWIQLCACKYKISVFCLGLMSLSIFFSLFYVFCDLNLRP